MLRRMIFAGSTVVLFTVALGAAPAAAQTVDEIIAKNHASKGGLEHWKTIQTQKMEAVVAVQGLELPMIIYGKRPNLGRQDVLVEVPGQPAMTMVNLFDGAKAWSINPMTGSDVPMELSGPEGEAVKDQSDFDGALIDYKAKGHTVELIGTESLGTKKVHHLKVTRKDQPAQHYYLDVDTGVELKISTEAGTGPAVDTELSDYKLIGRVLVPHQIKVMQGGMVQAEVRITKVDFNVPIDDAMFKIK